MAPEGEGRFTISQRGAEAREGLRGEITHRMAQIDGWMVPAGQDRAALEIAGLFAVMKVRGMDGMEADAMIGIYITDLAGLPYFALAESCKAFRRGTIGDGKWMPTVGEIHQAAIDAMKASTRERSELRGILAAQVETPKISSERKAELLAEAKAVAQAMRMTDKTHAPRLDVREEPAMERKATIQAELLADLDAKAKNNAAMPVRLSPAALKACGIEPPTMDEMRDFI